MSVRVETIPHDTALVELARSGAGALLLVRSGDRYQLELLHVGGTAVLSIDLATARKLKGRRKWVRR